MLTIIYPIKTFLQNILQGLFIFAKTTNYSLLVLVLGSPGGTEIHNLSANERDIRDSDLIPGLGRSRGIGNRNTLQHSCLENPMGT